MILDKIMPAALANHLWQSTVFALAAALLAFALRKNRAETRYWLWLAASLKFLIPFSILVAIGGTIHWPSTAPVVHSTFSTAVQYMGQPFAPAYAFTSGKVDGIIWRCKHHSGNCVCDLVVRICLRAARMDTKHVANCGGDAPRKTSGHGRPNSGPVM